jgi:hypothetical protein
MPAFTHAIAFTSGRRKADRKTYLVGQGIAASREVGTQLIGGSSEPALARVVIIGRGFHCEMFPSIEQSVYRRIDEQQLRQKRNSPRHVFHFLVVAM